MRMPSLSQACVNAQPLRKSADVCAVATLPVQLLYVAVTSTFPFNSLLSGLAGSAGFAVLTCAHHGIARCAESVHCDRMTPVALY